jgi:predicted  nucleic acid-binding Zn-ribbon protein
MDITALLSGIGISTTAVISFFAVLWYETKRNKEKHLENNDRVSKLENNIESLKSQIDKRFAVHQEKIQDIEKAYIGIETSIKAMNRRLDMVIEMLKEIYQSQNRG